MTFEGGIGDLVWVRMFFFSKPLEIARDIIVSPTYNGARVFFRAGYSCPPAPPPPPAPNFSLLAFPLKISLQDIFFLKSRVPSLPPSLSCLVP